MSNNTIPILPIEASQDGKRNAFAHYCPRIKQNRHYAVCLHLIDRRKDGRLDALYSDCSASIGRKDCPALSMRAEEKRENKAIYFQERIRALGAAFTTATAALLAGKNKIDQDALKAEVKPEPAKESKSTLIDKIDDTGYAAAINNAIVSGAHKETVPAKTVENKPAPKTREARKTKVEKAPETAPEIKAAIKAAPAGMVAQPGESLLELARRMMKQNGGSK